MTNLYTLYYISYYLQMQQVLQVCESSILDNFYLIRKEVSKVINEIKLLLVTV